MSARWLHEARIEGEGREFGFSEVREFWWMACRWLIVNGLFVWLAIENKRHGFVTAVFGTA